MRRIGLVLVFGLTRRRLLAVLTLGMMAAPLAVQAQQARKVYRIGILTSAPCLSEEPGSAGRMLFEGLRERGHTPGETVVFECRRSDEGREERFRQLASDIVGLKVDLIIGVGSAATRALRPATQSIPIVAIDLETDPVTSGLAVSHGRPGGNITGIFLDAVEMNGKRLQLLKEAVPRLSSVMVLWDPSTDAAPRRATETAARSLGLRHRTVPIRRASDLDSAFQTAAKGPADGVVLLGSTLLRFHQARIADLARQRRLPTIAHAPHYAHAGVLMSYGPDVGHLFHRAASFVDHILKGARPGDLPIERPSHFYLVVNQKTANALGLTIPQTLLLRADQVIE